MRVGTAGWSVTRDASAAFPAQGKHLQRYASVLNCAEINTSFYRHHHPEVYARWASETPDRFRFSVKLPKAITHEGQLRRAREPLTRFFGEVAGLGDKLGAVLIQLPPSLVYESRMARAFFKLLRDLHDGPVVCEARHLSWWSAAAERALQAMRISRVAADPAKWPEAAVPGGWLGPAGDGDGAVVYCRWHGSPRIYWSSYDPAWLAARATELRAWKHADVWAIFDNTASGAALTNALQLVDLLE